MQLVISANMLNNAQCIEILQLLELEIGNMRMARRRNGGYFGMEISENN